MAYLLDTATLAEVLRSVPSRSLVRRLASVPSAERWTTAITVSQILIAARRTRQPKLMQDVIRLVAAVKVAPFDTLAAQSFAKFRATVAGDVDTDDVMIAAIAVTHDFTLVTRRPEAFRRYPHLRVEDWTI
ncbi:PIN domain-containing protein [Polyangium aurulentum]|uniref:PIN domain-containing protein n=1 Tax=Polyangium aurulentum TaxID=2567896 RepID=UPI00146B9C97|nr:PIN domain-containing protein [Polyangium aurulentum]UQA62171.1 PIN domain-containing protein [Polyangium aurulentum]